MSSRIEWPDGKQFAFTITDDTDQSTVLKTKPLYDVLLDHGLRTTKTVWPLRARGKCITGGETLEDPGYLEWVRGLQDSGFEIALHGVADETSPRERVSTGLDRYRDLLGSDPRMHINHVGQKEGMYWGPARLHPPASWCYDAYLRYRGGIREYEGHVDASPLFWGDLCLSRTRYTRNLVWHDINTTKADPLFPYHDPSRPYVNYWFSATYGSGIRNFLRLVEQRNLDRLASEGGACIVYTHLGTFPAGAPEFSQAIARISRMNGWFVPASTLLDHIGGQRGWTNVAKKRRELLALELKWMLQQLKSPTG